MTDVGGVNILLRSVSRCIVPAALAMGALTGCPSPSLPQDAQSDATSDSADAAMDAAFDGSMDIVDLDSTDAVDAADVEEDAGPPPLPPCGTDSPLAMAACAERARYVTDLTFIAAPRVPGSAHWMEVQDLCASRLTELGFTVERQAYSTGVNVVGVRIGTTAPTEQVLLSAHYDHIADCPGADDNGSGVAAVLEAARVLSSRTFSRTLVAACWDEEERGLLGSTAYADAARARGDTIAVNYVFETMGYASSAPNSQRIAPGFNVLFPTQTREIQANMSRGDFLAVVADPSSHDASSDLAMFAAAVGLPIEVLDVPMSLLFSPATADLRRSDHASFWNTQYPGMMLTDTANFRNANYHCLGGQDTVDTLDHDFATKIVRATIAAATRALQ